MDALIILCILGIVVLAGFLLSLIELPEAPPPGLTDVNSSASTPAPRVHAPVGNQTTGGGIPNARLIAWSGSIWRSGR